MSSAISRQSPVSDWEGGKGVQSVEQARRRVHVRERARPTRQRHRLCDSSKVRRRPLGFRFDEFERDELDERGGGAEGDGTRVACCNQGHSVASSDAIRGTQWPAVMQSGATQWPAVMQSGATQWPAVMQSGATQWPAVRVGDGTRVAIRGASVVISGHQWSSVVIRGHPWSSVAIRRHQRQSRTPAAPHDQLGKSRFAQREGVPLLVPLLPHTAMQLRLRHPLL